jgi:hypothetical protein
VALIVTAALLQLLPRPPTQLVQVQELLEALVQYQPIDENELDLIDCQ